MQIIDSTFYKFSKNNKPVAIAKDGEELLFKTIDCFNEQIKTENDLITELDLDICNPTSGPVYIEGTQIGDVIAVDILNIEVAKVGYCASIPETGPLAHLAQNRTRVLNVKDGKVKFNDIEWEINPMVGVIGVAPANEDVISADASNHGGNMDNNLITKGTRVYLPVNTPGALLQMGDLHASMGNGEISCTGIEISGEVHVKVSIIKNFKLNWPLLETKDMYYINTASIPASFEKSQQDGFVELARLMEAAYGWDMTDIFMYLSLRGGVEVNASILPCHDAMITLRVGTPKIKGKELI